MKRSTYHPLSIVLHWLIFLLFVVALAAIEYRDELLQADPLRNILRTIHMHAGQLVFLLVLFRLAARWRFGVPEEASSGTLQKTAAQIVHFLLYFAMFALPISGILFTQAGGREVVFFGLQLPVLIAKDPAIRAPIKEFHEFVGNAIYYLVGLHVLGALWHQFIDKTPVLQRMMLRKPKDS